ncbi:ribonuclease HII [Rubidibacter lacunae]|nr:ribonuclease HII [Rubidibacter lacunae]
MHSSATPPDRKGDPPVWELGPSVDPQTLLAGVDEVGRGALFGPVVAAAVVMPQSALPQLVELEVKDSKQLTPLRRRKLVGYLQELAFDWRIGYATAAEIDRINILQASLRAMRRAVLKLAPRPALCLVDGRFALPELPMEQVPMVGGDRRSPAIAAASILAKVWRDDLIARFAQRYPEYYLASNKGYGTPAHGQALQRYGPSPQHRLSFRPCRVVSPHPSSED